jgi:NADH-quinone oxidoreductase subunit G
MSSKQFITVDGRNISFNGERNLLEVIRKANIEIPTFCYHSELSVYGACRMCLVDVEGRGLISSCSVMPEAGMKIKTNTQEIREIRKIAVELILANHQQDCPSCVKSSSCKLLEISNKLGVGKVRYKRTQKEAPIDVSSHGLIRDPNKCILCGDCVRACKEIQGIGAIDFAYRGSAVSVLPAFGKNLSQVECVECGQCARVCPTGSITPKFEVDAVFNSLENPDKTVVAQIAPAVRVAIGEMFGMKPGTVLTGQITAALKMLGFKKVFDTSFAADLTVIEEGNEFLTRKKVNQNLPLLTSCCPAWVKYCEQYFPEFVNNLSSCKSPQQMFGAVAKKVLPEQLGVKKEDLVVVSIMPCTAKKFESHRPEFSENGIPEVDHVITTQELAAMIKQAGIRFEQLAPESMDMPLGFKTGAGILFGASGGVTEAVLRYASEKITGSVLESVDFNEVRGEEGLREAKVQINGDELSIGIIHGLRNAKRVLENIKNRSKHFDFIEVMSCPGGCIGGAGQPVCFDEQTQKERTRSIYETDKSLQLHKAQENPYITELYQNLLGKPNSHEAHELLHTGYSNRKRIADESIRIIIGKNEDKLLINVCVGTNCFVKGSQSILNKLVNYIENNNLKDDVEVKATFCMENCQNGPSVSVGKKLLNNANFTAICAEIEEAAKKLHEVTV